MVTFLNFGDFSLIHFRIYLFCKCRNKSIFVDFMRFKLKYSLKTILIPLITYNIYFTSSNLQDQSSPMIFPTHKIIDLFHKTKHIQNIIRYSNYTRIGDWSGGFMLVRTICLALLFLVVLFIAS